MKRLSVIALVFSIAFSVFLLSPPFLNNSFGPYPLMKIADVLDLFTPLLLLPLYWLLFRLNGKPATISENILFMVFVAFWVLGQGMHLAANSIGHLLEEMESTDAFKLTGFYDETLSHYFWNFGVISLSSLLVYRQWRNPITTEKFVKTPLVLAGIFYGFTFFAMVIEGVTVPMGLPLAILLLIFTFILGRNNFDKKPLLFMFFTAYLIAIILFALWGIWQRGFPEFSEVGFI